MAAIIDLQKCTGCAECEGACPTGAISIQENHAVVSEECVDCGVCIDACPTGSITTP